MDVSRRKLFGIGAAVAAAAAVPEVAEAKPSNVVGPMLWERVCDSEWGCGTRFRFYGGTPICPKCYRLYCFSLEDIKNGMYKRIE